MTCHEVMDRVYEADGGENPPLVTQLRMQIHFFFCPRCSREFEKLQIARGLLGESFFPPSPSLEDAIMAQLAQIEEVPEEEYYGVAGVSFRSWVITGLVILLTLSTVFLGMDFLKPSYDWQSSLLLPVGITIGAIVTAYGAIFIGSHLKELTDRFNMH
ncbi:hypothetical protein TREPR_3423 [Treponema primitia ZAS-2]|uniref:Zinc-finger domain-containing protein n=1 Tax=Treponema primitia (strain ATCC BAA-887 / DSM 12427 / ZAS-2) TaxID=545694 RepID=F5YJJ4_TREPZ|nr:peptidoglycan-binding protein [Treponema primitia]AEF83885.1 hypothetical protein TREPR_3423 [Treponema primitia ZAS-2]